MRPNTRQGVNAIGDPPATTKQSISGQFSTVHQPQMNRGLVFLILLCGVFGYHAVNAETVDQPAPAPILFVTQHFPPFSYIEQGQVAGPARVLIDRACQLMQQRCHHDLLPWKRAQKLVLLGSAEGMYLIGKNPERSRTLSFSAPLLTTEYGFFVKGDDPLHAIRPDTLENYKVAVMDGSNTLASLQALKQQNYRFEIIEVTDSQTAFRLLAAGRVEAVYSNRDVGRALVSQLQLQDLHYAASHRQLDYYVGFNPDLISDEWVTEFNHQLETLRQQGETAKLLQRYGIR